MSNEEQIIIFVKTFDCCKNYVIEFYTTITVSKQFTKEMFNLIIKNIKLPRFGDLNCEGENSTPEQMYENFKQIFDTIFDKQKIEGIKKISNKERSVYEFDKYECHLVVYVRKDNISYSVRLNTINFQDDIRGITYFDANKMPYFEESLYLRILKDFGMLLERCKNLKYAPEYERDILPMGFANKNGLMWYEEKENEIITPMVYCKTPH